MSPHTHRPNMVIQSPRSINAPRNIRFRTVWRYDGLEVGGSASHHSVQVLRIYMSETDKHIEIAIHLDKTNQ